MNLPVWFLYFLSEQFNGTQVDFIDQNWHRYSQLIIKNSSREELLNECKTILSNMNHTNVVSN